MIRLVFLAAASFTVLACASPSDGLTREEARTQSSKSDELGVDLCLEQNWYGDGEICDDFCVFPDPDCEGNSFCTEDAGCAEGEACNAEALCITDCQGEGECSESCSGFCIPVAVPAARCGGPAELSCEEGQWCSFSDETIFERAEVTGTCRETPLLCATILFPVCGRDGNTYSSECNANRAGVDAVSEGSCERAEEEVEAEAEAETEAD